MQVRLAALSCPECRKRLTHIRSRCFPQLKGHNARYKDRLCESSSSHFASPIPVLMIALFDDAGRIPFASGLRSWYYNPPCMSASKPGMDKLRSLNEAKANALLRCPTRNASPPRRSFRTKLPRALRLDTSASSCE